MSHLILTIAYVVSGKLGLMLALPPGYASPIFPPAGIAVAAVLIGGRRTLPWIFLGSLLLNIWVNYSSHHQINAIDFIAVVTIAMASTLQAAIGGWCLWRVLGYPTTLDRGDEILRFLLLAPIICLISSTLSVSSLSTLGIFSTAEFTSNWAAWWVGDTLGVVVMVPLVMIIAGEPRELWQSRIRTIAVPVLLIFGLFVVIYLKVNKWEHDDSLSEFRQISQKVGNDIRTRLEVQESLLELTAGLFIHDSDGHLTREEFHRFIEKTLNHFPEISAIEWAPRVDSVHRAGFEAEQRKDFPGFEIRERNAAGELQRVGERRSLYPITFIEPHVGNEPALGFNLASVPELQTALAETLKHGIMVTTPPVQLVPGQSGMPLILSVKLGGNESGFVLTVLRLNEFIDKLLSAQPMIYVRLTDLAGQKTLYDNFAPGDQKALHAHIFSFGTRNYRLETSPTPVYLTQHHGWQSWSVLAAGILCTGLLSSLLLIGTGYTVRVESEVQSRTRELKESEQRLQLAIDASSGGVWEWNLVTDEVLFTPQWLKIFGYSPGDVESNINAWKKRIHPDDLLHISDKLQDHFSGKTPVYECEYRIKSRTGVWEWSYSRGMVVNRDASHKPLRMVGIDLNITVRKQREETISQMVKHFDASPDFIGFADARDAHVTYINPAGRAIVGIGKDEDVTRLKITDIHLPRLNQMLLDEVLPYAAHNGSWSGESVFLHRDGREIPMLMVVVAHKSANGEVEAWSTISHNITQRKQTEERLKLYAKELARSNDALRDFAAIASHDLQDPLRKIIAFGDRLRTAGTFNQQGEDYLGRMKKSTQRMQQFIQDLLEYSKVSYKPKELQRVNLNEVISEVISDLEYRLAREQGAIEIGELPSIETDKLQMRQFFQNMIGNALKFHKPGVPPRVSVSSRNAGPGQWEIAIQDNGIGFDIKNLGRIMQPFQRLNGHSKYEGSGMGLAICHKIIENHGGKISADSSPEKGTRFIVLLPEMQSLDI